MILSTGSYTNKKRTAFKPTRIESHLNLKIPADNISTTSNGDTFVKTYNSYFRCVEDFKIYKATSHANILSIPLKENKDAIKALFKGNRNESNHLFKTKSLSLCSKSPQVRYD